MIKRTWNLEEERAKLPEYRAKRFPYGIKVGLARLVALTVPHAIEYFRITKGNETERDIIYLEIREGIRYLCCRRWYFPHPSKNPELVWKRGPGLDIPEKDFDYYARATQALIDWAASPECVPNYYIREYVYSDASVVRFAVNETRSKTHYCHIQIFRRAKTGRYLRTKSGIHAPAKDPILFKQLIIQLHKELAKTGTSHPHPDYFDGTP